MCHARTDWDDVSYYLSMRDGVRLAISNYFPDHLHPARPAPVILVQTRYGRAGRSSKAAITHERLTRGSMPITSPRR